MSQQKNHGGCFKEEYGDRIEVEVYRGLYDGRLHEHREAELLEWISLMAVFEPSRHP